MQIIFWLLAFPVINEVMANPAGLESGAGAPGDRNEFVELYNPEAETINLEGYWITDGDAVDSLIPFPYDIGVGIRGYKIPPGGYAVILDPEYVDTGDGSYVMPYSFPDGVVLLSVANTTIGDGLSTLDPVMLITSMSDTVSTYGSPCDTSDGIPFDPGDGVSVERLRPDMEDREGAWASCADSVGCTPGKCNSVYVPPGVYVDSVCWSSDTMFVFLHSDTVDAVSVEILLLADRDFDGEGEMVLDRVNVDVAPGEGLVCKRWIELGDAVWRVGAGIGDSVVWVEGREEGLGPVIINEIMAVAGESGEWVELYNRGDCDICLGGFKLGECVLDTVVLKPDDFVVLCKDRTLMFGCYGNIPCWVLELPSFPSLPNDGGSVVFYTPMGVVVDSVVYTPQWGDERGYSYERVHPDSTRFGLSIAREGATPGERNSLLLIGDIEGEVLMLSQPSFKLGEDLWIDYVVRIESDVKLLVFSRSGVVMTTLVDAHLREGRYRSRWDGRTDTGEVLPPDLYILVLVVDGKVKKKVVGFYP